MMIQKDTELFEIIQSRDSDTVSKGVKKGRNHIHRNGQTSKMGVWSSVKC